MHSLNNQNAPHQRVILLPVKKGAGIRAVAMNFSSENARIQFQYKVANYANKWEGVPSPMVQAPGD
jgi:hypothetical protein